MSVRADQTTFSTKYKNDIKTLEVITLVFIPPKGKKGEDFGVGELVSDTEKFSELECCCKKKDKTLHKVILNVLFYYYFFLHKIFRHEYCKILCFSTVDICAACDTGECQLQNQNHLLINFLLTLRRLHFRYGCCVHCGEQGAKEHLK